MKNKAKYLLVFICTALFLSLLTLIVLSAIAWSHVEAAYGDEVTSPDKGVEGVPLYPISEIIYLRYEKYQSIKENPKGDRQALGGERVWAWVTQYTCVESSRNGVCINASGRRPIEGISIACPRSVSTGSRVVIDEEPFICDDRTHPRFDGRFDIFVEDYEKALSFGKQWKEITIIN